MFCSRLKPIQNVSVFRIKLSGNLGFFHGKVMELSWNFLIFQSGNPGIAIRSQVFRRLSAPYLSISNARSSLKISRQFSTRYQSVDDEMTSGGVPMPLRTLLEGNQQNRYADALKQTLKSVKRRECI